MGIAELINGARIRATRWLHPSRLTSLMMWVAVKSAVMPSVEVTARRPTTYS